MMSIIMAAVTTYHKTNTVIAYACVHKDILTMGKYSLSCIIKYVWYLIIHKKCMCFLGRRICITEAFSFVCIHTCSHWATSRQSSCSNLLQLELLWSVWENEYKRGNHGVFIECLQYKLHFIRHVDNGCSYRTTNYNGEKHWLANILLSPSWRW